MNLLSYIGSLYSKLKLDEIYIIDVFVYKVKTIIYKTPGIFCGNRINYKKDFVDRATDKLCIFAHYDANDSIDDYVVVYLERLYLLGFKIVFVSTAVKLPDEEISKISNIVFRVIRRKNIGYDFGSWKTGLDSIDDLGQYEKIVFCNDSVYGPLCDLKPIFETMDRRSLDMWSITDSYEHRYHLQSYFIVCNARLIKSEVFLKFWSGFKYYSNELKKCIIKEYEIGMSSAVSRSGYKIGAYIGYFDLLASIAHGNIECGEYIEKVMSSKVNPSQILWKEAILLANSPFLKVNVVKHNRDAMKEWNSWASVVTSRGYNIELIVEPLRKT